MRLWVGTTACYKAVVPRDGQSANIPRPRFCAETRETRASSEKSGLGLADPGGARSKRYWLTARQRSSVSQSCSSPRYTRSSPTSRRATTLMLRSGASVADGNESIADTSSGSCVPRRPRARWRAPAGRGRGKRRQRPREHQRERKLVGRLLVVALREHGILEGEQRPRVDIE